MDHFDANPDPDPICHFDADLDPFPTFDFLMRIHIRILILVKVMRIFDYWYTNPLFFHNFFKHACRDSALRYLCRISEPTHVPTYLDGGGRGGGMATNNNATIIIVIRII